MPPPFPMTPSYVVLATLILSSSSSALVLRLPLHGARHSAAVQMRPAQHPPAVDLRLSEAAASGSYDGRVVKTAAATRDLSKNRLAPLALAGAGVSACVALLVGSGAAAAAFTWYEMMALARPVITKSATSGVAYCMGEALAQKHAGARE